MKKKTWTALILFLVLMMAAPLTVNAGWKVNSSGNYYYYNSKGVLQKNKWIGRRYVDAKGKWVKNRSYIEKSKYAKKFSQLMLVEAKGNRATVSLHTRNAKGQWYVKLTSSGYVGRNGVGKTREGDLKTPNGLFTMSKAFGINSNPGTSMAYRKVDGTWYWVSDPRSKYYNKFVTTKKVKRDWGEAERIIDYTTAYRYVLSVDYNKKCVPGKGSAIFLHCSTGGPTAGCVSVPQSAMVKILKQIKPGARIAIGTEASLKKLLGC